MRNLCSVPGCERPEASRGWCKGHWQRWSRTGSPGRAEFGPVPPEERFWRFVDKTPAGCWEWTGWRAPGGYGQFDLGQHRRIYAHRYAYEILVGPIPEGLTIDHLCMNPPCCNPKHLEPVTQAVNNARGPNARKTHCPQGHPYEGSNVGYTKTGHRRYCKTCLREKSAERRARERLLRQSRPKP